MIFEYMDLRQCAAALAVLDTGSYSAAGRRIHLSQPALWAQVKGLEAALGFPLFSRVGRGVIPTGACRALEPRLRALVAQAASMNDAARAILAGDEAPARVGCTAIIVPFLARCIGRLLKRHPSTPAPVLVSTTSEQLEADLAHARFDLLIHPRLPGTEGVPLFPVRMLAVGQGVSGSTWDVRRLASTRVATLPPDSGIRTLLERAAREARISLNVYYESREVRALLALASAGVCTAVVLDEMLEPTEAKLGVPLVSPRVKLQDKMWLLWRSQDSLSPAAALMRDAIVEEAKKPRR
jgi:DNA-binding transcriptional LysR family regulator